MTKLIESRLSPSQQYFSHVTSPREREKEKKNKMD